MTQTIINKHDVSVSTVAVEIQIVRIGGKQMTLSVFDQVIEESILDKRATSLKGEAIGKIRNKSKWFVLWTKNGELRKCELPILKREEPLASGALKVLREWFKKEDKSIYKEENTYLEHNLKFHGFWNNRKGFIAISPQEVRRILVLNGFKVNEIWKEWKDKDILMPCKENKAAQSTYLPYNGGERKRMLRFPVDVLVQEDEDNEEETLSIDVEDSMKHVVENLKKLEQLFIAV